MDFEPTEDQQQLRNAVRAVLESFRGDALARRAHEAARLGHGEPATASTAPVWAQLWSQMVELDWPALAVPPAAGGLRASFVEVSIVAEEIGRYIAPGPFLATATQFVPAVLEAGSAVQQEALLRPVAEQGRTGTLAVAEPDGRWEPQALRAVALPTRGGTWRLHGRKSWVMEGCNAEEVVVAARAEGSQAREGIGMFVVSAKALRARPIVTLDPTLGLAELDLDGAEVGPERVLATPGDPKAARALERAMQEATVALALATTGTCRAIFDTTLQYAKDRVQYGRPIGSFQAIKHRLVDMYLALERASSLAWYAALSIAEDTERRSLATSMAKAAAGDCQRLVAQDGLQLHGGIGMTWEHDLHLYLKRAKAGEALFGSANRHRLLVSEMLGLAA